MRITAEQASARIRAGLGREPQDALEASVVLEAWGGLVAPSALPLAHAATASRRPPAPVALTRRVAGEVSTESGREVLGLIAALLATTAWVAPLSTALGAGPVETAWKVALPVSLAVQWFVRRRYLTDVQGMGRLRADRPALALGAAVVVLTLLGLVLDAAVALPAALTVTWVGGLVVVVRGWGLPYAAGLVLAGLAMSWGLPVVADVGLVVGLTAVAVAAALRSSPSVTSHPTPVARSLAAGAIGGSMALLIVLDPSVEWSSSRAFPVVALVPSLLGSVWAGRHLNRIWTVLLDALASTDLADRTHPRSRRVFGGIIAGAFARLLAVTALVSLFVFALVRPGAASDRGLVVLLLGLGCFGVIGFLAALLESFSRLLSAGLVVAAALTTSAAVAYGPVDVGTPALVLAAVVAVLVAVPPLARLVSQPDRTLATMF